MDDNMDEKPLDLLDLDAKLQDEMRKRHVDQGRRRFRNIVIAAVMAVLLVVGLLVTSFVMLAATQQDINAESRDRCVVIRALVDKSVPKGGTSLQIPEVVNGVEVDPGIRAVLQAIVDSSAKSGQERGAEIRAVADKYLPEHC